MKELEKAPKHGNFGKRWVIHKLALTPYAVFCQKEEKGKKSLSFSLPYTMGQRKGKGGGGKRMKSRQKENFVSSCVQS